MPVTETIATRYREMRAEHPVAASTALAWARTPEPESFDFGHGGDRAEFERDGFHVVIRIEIDEMPDPFVTMTDDDPSHELGGEESMYRNPHAWSDGEPIGREHYRYARPMSGYNEHRAALAKYGYSRQDADVTARRYVRQEIEAATDYDNAPCVVLVTVTRNGVELGGASLGGITLDANDDPQSQLERVIDDHAMVSEAIADARETLAGLCEGER
jgi:hypothetical protein